MNFDDLTTYFGTLKEMSDCFGVNQCVPFKWRNEGIPILRQFMIEVMTDGLFTVDRSQLDPEISSKWEKVKKKNAFLLNRTNR